MNYENEPEKPSSEDCPAFPDLEGLLDLLFQPDGGDIITFDEESGTWKAYGPKRRHVDPARDPSVTYAFEVTEASAFHLTQTLKPFGRSTHADEGTMSRFANLTHDISEAIPFVGEYPRSLLEYDSPWAIDREVELEPAEWAGKTAPQKRAQRKLRFSDRSDCLVNPAILAAKYERESLEGEETGIANHPFAPKGDLSERGRMMLASEELSLLWEGKIDLSIYDLLKGLVLRIVITDSEVSDRVLGKAEEYLAKKARELAPMTKMWRYEAGLDQSLDD